MVIFIQRLCHAYFFHTNQEIAMMSHKDTVQSKVKLDYAGRIISLLSSASHFFPAFFRLLFFSYRFPLPCEEWHFDDR